MTDSNSRRKPNYTVAGIGVRLRANALRCKACQVQPQQFQTGFSIEKQQSLAFDP